MRCLLVVLLTCGLGTLARGETISFGRDVSPFTMEFVTIGQPENPADDANSGGEMWGSVDYLYRIGKFEVNCKAFNSLGPFGSNFCDIAEQDHPALGSVEDVAAYINALNEDRGRHPAYNISSASDGTTVIPWSSADAGYDPDNPMRNSLARFVLPTADEWHKAAYYDPATESYFDFATGLNRAITIAGNTTLPGTFVFGGRAVTTQAGGLSPFGTMGQTGNIAEWEEPQYDFNREVLAGYYRSGEMDGLFNQTASLSRRLASGSVIGFRVVDLIPEPSSRALCFIAAISLLACRVGRSRRCTSWPMVSP